MREKEIVAADIGGTHARFGLATVRNGRVQRLDAVEVFNCADFPSLSHAWRAYGRSLGRRLPRAAGIAVACPVSGQVLKMTNMPWVIRPDALRQELEVDDLTLINDFGAVGHAIAQAQTTELVPLCGPDRAMPDSGAITIVGPGTGLGVACILRSGGQDYTILETEGSHIDYAPLDEVEEAIHHFMRKRLKRVSVERLISGMGLSALYEALAHLEGRPTTIHDNKALWMAAMNGEDELAARALERFCLSLGSFAGDMALAHGASAVIIAGGVGARLAGHLPRSGFAQRFSAKGRFQGRMQDLPVKIVTTHDPGLFGAAAAYADGCCSHKPG
ncbi:glucokinase [Formicincola oecophyllae]|uniref:glucokinase n=1 Tax=Formicincola oecophyllae TaxID=2558361 RepID=UPI001F111A49|nr:glucokinase [Formicincola oecophyllae]